MVTADSQEPGLRIYHHNAAMSVSILNDPQRSPLGLIRVLVAEVLREVPDADFIEIRAVRIDEEKGDLDGVSA